MWKISANKTYWIYVYSVSSPITKPVHSVATHTKTTILNKHTLQPNGRMKSIDHFVYFFFLFSI